MRRAPTVSGSVVVVAKCPIPGRSKTRLIPLTGVDGSAQLATAMLADVLTALTQAETEKNFDRILLYAPPTDVGKLTMENLLDRFGIPRQRTDDNDASEVMSTKSYKSSKSDRKHTQSWNPDAWTLLPMSNEKLNSEGDPIDHSSSKPLNLKSSYLSDILENALHRVRLRLRKLKSDGPVIFVGMDTPDIPLDELAYALEDYKRARVCPSADGGYGLLSVPHHAPAERIFAGVRWSDPLTLASQLKALTDEDVRVTVGRVMYDVDEPDDVVQLVERLQESERRLDGSEEDQHDNLVKAPPTTVRQERRTGSCVFTIQALQELQLWGSDGKLRKLKKGSHEHSDDGIIAKQATLSTSYSTHDHEEDYGEEVLIHSYTSSAYEEGFVPSHDMAGSHSCSL
ncbi:hypothetical protein FisN_25Hh220 [Fistulifera solaris]|uniref:DUF2064 domain-containing protein n=1 Tax=Fistulifera solaris TaxID=1519565 RepID=A0A1Z5K6U4_FISSO|nr:hypothetical protein FisN_25Hh220 [Fistulifera solaris]|eukprot:GAX21980.1 hypothetical protein FisN_25Hh220 [Fistulifera solaris]